MQEAVAEPFGFGSGEVAVEGEVVGPGEEILRHADDGEPCLVDGEAGRGQVGEPEVFGVADRSFGSPSAAVEGFEVGDVIVVEVGDHQLEAVAVDVGEGELRAGMWVFAAGDHPGRGRPSGQVDQSGDLGDLGSFSFVAAVDGDSWPPAAIGQSGNDRGELGGEAMPDDEPDLALAAGIQEAVGQPGGIGAGDHLRGRHRQLGEGGVEHRYVIGSGAGAGVAGPQQHGQLLAGGILPGAQRVEPEPALVGRRRLFLLRVRPDQGGVDVDHVEVRVHARRPRPCTGSGPGLADAAQGGVIDGLQGPPRRRRRRHLPEQGGLVAQHRQIRDRLAAVGERHRQVD